MTYPIQCTFQQISFSEIYIPETVVFQLKYGAIRNNKMIRLRLIVAHIVTSTTDPEQSSKKQQKVINREKKREMGKYNLTIHAEGNLPSITPHRTNAIDKQMLGETTSK